MLSLNRVRLAGLLVVLWACIVPLLAVDCGSCGRKGLSALTMHCPDCRSLLNVPTNRVKARSSAILVVELFYTGEKPEKLPEYGKLYINRKYVGNIPQTEREARGQSLTTPGRTGLGFDYTAKYAIELRELHVGVVNVEVEMRFKRLFGVSRSHRRVLFRNVSLKADEKTRVTQYFDHAVTFSKLQPELKNKPGETRSDSYVPEIKTGTGTLSLETPVF